MHKVKEAEDFNLSEFSKVSKEVSGQLKEILGAMASTLLAAYPCESHNGSACNCSERVAAFVSALRIHVGILDNGMRDFNPLSPQIKKVIDEYVKISIADAENQMSAEASEPAEPTPQSDFNIN